MKGSIHRPHMIVALVVNGHATRSRCLLKKISRVQPTNTNLSSLMKQYSSKYSFKKTA